MADDSETMARRALPLVDLTSLNDSDTPEDIARLCRRAVTPAGHVAGVCIYPRFVARAREALAGSGIRVVTVVNFPHGTDAADAAAADAAAAVRAGAEEIDVVVPYRDLIAGDGTTTAALLAGCRQACGAGVPIKAILETGAFDGDRQRLAFAAETAIHAGADFLKTSTGKLAVGATPEAAETLLETIARLGAPVGFKAAGGIRTVDDAGVYLALAARVMGEQWITPRTFRLGASSLLDDLLATLGHQREPDGPPTAY